MEKDGEGDKKEVKGWKGRGKDLPDQCQTASYARAVHALGLPDNTCKNTGQLIQVRSSPSNRKQPTPTLPQLFPSSSLPPFPLPLFPLHPFLFPIIFLSAKFSHRVCRSAVNSPSGVRGGVPAANRFFTFWALKTHLVKAF